MDWGGPDFVIAIVAISTFGWVLNNWIRARHGFSVSDDWGRNVQREDPAVQRERQLLIGENERLAGQVSRLEERLAVLERIATDPGTRTAREIDLLRDA